MTAAAYRDLLRQLRAHQLVPHDPIAVFVAGSRVRGWGNESSDIDLYVICAQPWHAIGTSRAMVSVAPGAISVLRREVGHRHCDIQYWHHDQVSEVLGRVSWEEFDSNLSADILLTATEADLLERLTYGIALEGQDWLDDRRRELERSALRPVLVTRALRWTSVYIEDARGQLSSRDVESAVLSARIAFGHAIRALLADNGKYAQSAKWFARQLRETNQSLLSFDDYWDIETMRGYDPADPGMWVEDVIMVCDKIALGVQV